MNNASRSIFVGAASVLVLAACQKSDAPAMTSNSASSQPAINTTFTPQMPTGDASLPHAATPYSTQDAAGKTITTPDTNALQHKAAPQGKMTQEEESKAMPLPGQANDHSSAALDKGKGG